MSREHKQAPYDFNLIAELVPVGSRVLDLGCGDGTLLEKLYLERRAFIQGIDIDPVMIQRCVEKGVPVVQGNLDWVLQDFNDSSFDVVILSQTLQVVKKPDFVLQHMLRVGKKAIVSIPNFGYWVNRFQLFFLGQMPVTKDLPYAWYNTPNIHFCTIKDFRHFIKNQGWKLNAEYFLRSGKLTKMPMPNLFATDLIAIIEK
jgi:methionine biosynthesis protein MetW